MKNKQKTKQLIYVFDNLSYGTQNPIDFTGVGLEIQKVSHRVHLGTLLSFFPCVIHPSFLNGFLTYDLHKLIF